MKKFIVLLILTLICVVFPVDTSAAAPDGSGPWSDGVVTASQGNMKNGLSVPPERSNPESAVGIAEETIGSGTFFSLGFGGSITLQFDNGVRDGVLVVESTNPDYPQERATVEVSADNSVWYTAGTLTQTGEVALPEQASCIRYVRITDSSNANDFGDETADGYDVDGVKALHAEVCETGETPTPILTQIITPTPTNVPSTTSEGASNTSSSNPQGKVCTATKPGTPQISSVTKTSSTTVRLVWTAVSPVTTYAISYGTTSGNYQYGVASTGNVTEYSVGGLDPNATYYFIVRAIHDCQPGDASTERSISGGQVLGASTTNGQVLGVSTDVLASTGTLSDMIAFAAAVLSAWIAGSIYYRKTVHGKQ